MKTFDEFLNEKVIKYAMAKAATVYTPSGETKHLKKGTAMAKRSSSSVGGNGD